MNRKVFGVAAICVVMLFINTVAFAQSAVIRETTGRVEIRVPGGQWQSAVLGRSVPIGSSISTGFDSTAVLEIASATLRVRPLTRLSLEDLYEQDDTVTTEVFLRVGRVRGEVRTTEGLQNDFRLRSPVSTAAVRGTEFEYDGVNLQVFDGVVAFSNLINQTRVVSRGASMATSGADVPATRERSRIEGSSVETTTRPILSSPYEGVVVRPESVDEPVVRTPTTESPEDARIIIRWE